MQKNYDIKTLKNKAANKKALQEAFHLPVEKDVPLFAMCTRLVDHKGLDLVKGVFHELMACNMQFVLLGSGDDEYETFFHHMGEQYKDKFSFIRGFIPSLAHQLYAGADVFLMPSKSEPCGLAQMVSLRYGTIPIVRETGGLADTIIDSGDGEGYGFTFKSYNAHDMLQTVYRALEGYSDKKGWTTLCKRAMTVDVSWAKSAGEYLALYKDMKNSNPV